MRFCLLLLTASLAAANLTADLESARDRQDRPALEKLAGELAQAAARNGNDAAAQYNMALAQSLLAEVALELKDRNLARTAAEAGIKAAEKAVSLKPSDAENNRILGTLCGQAISGNVLSAFKYGHCAQDAINKAVELDPKSARAWLSRGVGNYYLPPAFGGGAEASIRDCQKAVELDPKSSEAHLWLGLALRKANRMADARKALARAVQLNPNRVWAKQQLDKTPAQ